MKKGIYKIKKPEIVDKLVEKGHIGKGTANTGRNALKLKIPLFIVFPKHIKPEKASKMLLKELQIKPVEKGE